MASSSQSKRRLARSSSSRSLTQLDLSTPPSQPKPRLARSSSSKSLTQLQPSTSASFTNDHKISHLVNFLLQRSAKPTPLKLAEMMPFVDGSRPELMARLPHVENILRNTYGILLTELKDRRNGIRHILTATTPPASPLELTPKQRSKRTLLWIVLSYIFLRRTNVPELQLQKFLEMININWDEEHHYFGNVKKMIEETFVKEVYLKRIKEVECGLEEVSIVYTWGERADCEIRKTELLAFSQSFMNIDPNLYKTQIADEGVNDTQNTMLID